MMSEAEIEMAKRIDPAVPGTPAGETEPKPSSERTCAGCRQHDAREALVRLAVSEDVSTPLVPDLRGRLGGRGVSVHPSRACLTLAVKKGGFARSLSRAVAVDEAALARAIEEQLLGRAKGLLLGGIRAKRIELGTEAVLRTIEAQKIELLVLAHDAAGRSIQLGERVRAAGKPVAVLADKAFLGGLTSRAELGVLAVVDRGIATELGQVAAMLATMTSGRDVVSGASPVVDAVALDLEVEAEAEAE
jgi:predicted RNA-binding protein YlxR (DUF448 family)